MKVSHEHYFTHFLQNIGIQRPRLSKTVDFQAKAKQEASEVNGKGYSEFE